MISEVTNDYGKMSAEEKKRHMLERKLETLKSFYERNAITKENYDKGVIALKKEIKTMEK